MCLELIEILFPFYFNQKKMEEMQKKINFLPDFWQVQVSMNKAGFFPQHSDVKFFYERALPSSFVMVIISGLLFNAQNIKSAVPGVS